MATQDNVEVPGVESLTSAPHQEFVNVRLPPLMAFRRGSSGNFLGVIRTENDQNNNRVAYHPSHDPDNPRCQFAVEKATTEPGKSRGDMHIKSRFNDKYLLRASGSSLVIAGAAEPNEEYDSIIRCTLFSANNIVGTPLTNLYSIGRHLLVCQNFLPDGFLYWVITATGSIPVSWFHVVEINQLKLPRVVSFKGHNGLFLLASQHQDGRMYNIFNGSHLGEREPSVMYEIIPTSEINRVRLKSYFYDKFLKRAPDNCVVLSEETDNNTDDRDTVFTVRKENDNVVVLLNVGNQNICTMGEGNRLYAGAEYTAPVPPWANLEVVEPVVSRTIVVLPNDFHMGEATVFDHETIEMDNKIASNPTNVTRLVTLELSYTKDRSGIWDNAETIKWGGEAEFRSSIPQIVSDLEVGIEGVHEGLYRWGQPTSEVSRTPIFRQVVVPPKTEIHVTLVGKKASCKVPFSYLQTDVLESGPDRVYNKDDGHYSGICTYSFDIKEEPKALP